jgi:hypothetical protein
MRDMGMVWGSAEMAVPLFVGKDTVYVHTDIQEILDFGGSPMWRYHEVQYDKDEYVRLMSEKNDDLSEILNTMLGVNPDE